LSDIAKLIIGIVLVIVGLGIVLEAGAGIWPLLGGAIGLVGAGLTIFTIITGHFESR